MVVEAEFRMRIGMYFGLIYDLSILYRSAQIIATSHELTPRGS